MSKYGYKGGYNRAADYGLNDNLDPESSEYRKLREEQFRIENRKKNFDQRFGGVFQAAKKRKWYHFIYDTPNKRNATAIFLGCAGASIFYWGVLSTFNTFQRSPTDEELRERDIIIKKVFDTHGHRWYSPLITLAYSSEYARWKELKLEDHKRQRRQLAAESFDQD